jgi:hypothetical protein
MQIRCRVASLMILALVGFFSSPAGGQDDTPGAVQVKDAAICQQILHREPIGTNTVFPKGIEKLFCYTRVVGATGNTEITHNWYYQGSLQSSVVLTVDSGNWRTWSSKTISADMTGEWMVEILSKEGTPLESLIFFIR